MVPALEDGSFSFAHSIIHKDRKEPEKAVAVLALFLPSASQAL